MAALRRSCRDVSGGDEAARPTASRAPRYWPATTPAAAWPSSRARRVRLVRRPHSVAVREGSCAHCGCGDGDGDCSRLFLILDCSRMMLLGLAVLHRPKKSSKNIIVKCAVFIAIAKRVHILAVRAKTELLPSVKANQCDQFP